MLDTSEGPAKAGGGVNSLLTAFVQGSTWLIPLASVSPTTPQNMGRTRTQELQVQNHQVSTARGISYSLTPVCHEDKGLLSFLSFQFPSLHPLFFWFPACNLLRSRRVNGCIPGPRGEVQGAKIAFCPILQRAHIC